MSDKQLTIKPWDRDFFIDDSGFDLCGAGEDVAVYVNTDRLGYEVDPEAVRDFFESLRPTQRYGVIADGPRVSVQDLTLPYTVATFYGRNRKADAEEYAALLNEREATK